MHFKNFIIAILILLLYLYDYYIPSFELVDIP